MQLKSNIHAMISALPFVLGLDHRAAHNQWSRKAQPRSVDHSGPASANVSSPSYHALAAEASIDLTKPFEYYSIGRDMYQKKGPYAFAFDAVNQRLFFSVPSNPDSPTPLDHNCVVYIDINTHDSAYMYLHDFGPANVSFAAEPVGNNTRLWFEVDPDETGCATKLAAFLWEPEKELHNPSPELTKIAPVEGANDYSSTYDHSTGRLVIRYRSREGEYHMAAYESSRAAAGDFSNSLYSFRVPPLDTKAETIRGYTALGQHLYILTGDPSSTEDFNGTLTEITNINIDTLEITQGPSITSLLRGFALDPTAQGLGFYYAQDGSQELVMGVVGVHAAQRKAYLYSNKMLNV
jgi:hypothetical protein